MRRTMIILLAVVVMFVVAIGVLSFAVGDGRHHDDSVPTTVIPSPPPSPSLIYIVPGEPSTPSAIVSPSPR